MYTGRVNNAHITTTKVSCVFFLGGFKGGCQGVRATRRVDGGNGWGVFGGGEDLRCFLPSPLSLVVGQANIPSDPGASHD